MQAETNESRTRRFVFSGAALLALAAPLTYSLNLGLVSAKGKPAGPYVTAAMILCVLAAAALLFYAVSSKSWRSLRMPTFWALALFAWYLSGFVRRTEDVPVGSMEILKESVQVLLYFGIAYSVFISAMDSRKRTALFIDALMAAASVCYIVALVQYFGSSTHDFFVGGTFENNSQLSAFAAVTSPLFLGYAFSSRRKSRIAAALLLLAAAFVLTMNGWMFISLAAGLAVYLFLCGPWTGAICVASLALILAFALPALPRDNIARMKFSLGIYHKDNTEMVGEGWQKKTYVVSTRARNWQASYEAFTDRPWLGSAPSSYQNSVRAVFNFDPKFPAATNDPVAFDIHVDEPSSFSTYLVLIVEEGIIGLCLFLFLVLAALRCSVLSLSGSNAVASIGRGVTASLVAVVIAMQFTDFLDRGLAFVLVFVFAVAFVMYEYAQGYREE
ncbi:MAG: O-antigen ligase family protein [Candidatus Brocadiia bacterium]